MAQSVVHDFQCVEVEKHDRQPLLLSLHIRHGDADAIEQQRAVGQRSQLVVIGAESDIAFDALAIVDIEKNALQRWLVSAIARNEPDVFERPHRPPAAVAKLHLFVEHGTVCKKAPYDVFAVVGVHVSDRAIGGQEILRELEAKQARACVIAADDFPVD